MPWGLCAPLSAPNTHFLSSVACRDGSCESRGWERSVCFFLPVSVLMFCFLPSFPFVRSSLHEWCIHMHVCTQTQALLFILSFWYMPVVGRRLTGLFMFWRRSPLKTSSPVIASLWLRVPYTSAGTSLQIGVPEIHVAKSLEFSPFLPRGFLAHFWPCVRWVCIYCCL